MRVQPRGVPRAVPQVLDAFESAKELHLYDSFAALPATVEADGDAYREGDLTTSIEGVRENCRRYGPAQPTVHPGWFNDTLPTGLPSVISFAHLDGDLYASIMESLRHTYPRLSRDVCVVDDYCDPDTRPDGWNHFRASSTPPTSSSRRSPSA